MSINMTEPAVSRLSVYLPDTDPVCFTDEADPSAAAANTVAPQTRYLLRPAAPLFDDVLLLPYFFLYDAKNPAQRLQRSTATTTSTLTNFVYGSGRTTTFPGYTVLRRVRSGRTIYASCS